MPADPAPTLRALDGLLVRTIRLLTEYQDLRLRLLLLREPPIVVPGNRMARVWADVDAVYLRAVTVLEDLQARLLRGEDGRDAR